MYFKQTIKAFSVVEKKFKNVIALYSFLKIDNNISNRIENFKSYVNRKKNTYF